MILISTSPSCLYQLPLSFSWSCSSPTCPPPPHHLDNKCSALTCSFWSAVIRSRRSPLCLITATAVVFRQAYIIIIFGIMLFAQNGSAMKWTELIELRYLFSRATPTRGRRPEFYLLVEMSSICCSEGGDLDTSAAPAELAYYYSFKQHHTPECSNTDDRHYEAALWYGWAGQSRRGQSGHGREALRWQMVVNVKVKTCPFSDTGNTTVTNCNRGLLTLLQSQYLHSLAKTHWHSSYFMPVVHKDCAKYWVCIDTTFATKTELSIV